MPEIEEYEKACYTLLWQRKWSISSSWHLCSQHHGTTIMRPDRPPQTTRKPSASWAPPSNHSLFFKWLWVKINLTGIFEWQGPPKLQSIFGIVFGGSLRYSRSFDPCPLTTSPKKIQPLHHFNPFIVQRLIPLLLLGHLAIAFCARRARTAAPCPTKQRDAGNASGMSVAVQSSMQFRGQKNQNGCDFSFWKQTESQKEHIFFCKYEVYKYLCMLYPSTICWWANSKIIREISCVSRCFYQKSGAFRLIPGISFKSGRKGG